MTHLRNAGVLLVLGTVFGVAGVMPAMAASSCAVPTVSLSPEKQNKPAITAIHAKIKELKASLGAQDGILCETPDGRGKYWHFKNGSVYWSPETGAKGVFGLIRQRWAQLGWEKSYLGYPMTDEMDTYDTAAKVSKFQGGQLTWRPWTNKVTEGKASDLKVDLPIPTSEEWRVGQANDPNNTVSHNGPWVYCYDLNRTSETTNGKPVHAAATAQLVAVHDGAPDSANTNIIVQDLGVGRYASYLHLKKDSHTNAGTVTGTTPWKDRPVVKNGAKVAEVGAWEIPNPGGKPHDNSHIHFCVTTAPDVGDWGPFESTPFVFRNYEKKVGNTWVHVAEGRPAKDDVLRRKVTTKNDGAAEIYGFSGINLLNYGTLSGTITMGGNTLPPNDKIAVEVVSEWGEPIVATYISVQQGKNGGPYTYKLNVPSYKEMTVRARWVKSDFNLSSNTVTFDGKPGQDTRIDLPMTSKN